jgi:hypothetical protein
MSGAMDAMLMSPSKRDRVIFEAEQAMSEHPNGCGECCGRGSLVYKVYGETIVQKCDICLGHGFRILHVGEADRERKSTLTFAREFLCQFPDEK